MVLDQISTIGMGYDDTLTEQQFKEGPNPNDSGVIKNQILTPGSDTSKWHFYEEWTASDMVISWRFWFLKL